MSRIPQSGDIIVVVTNSSQLESIHWDRCKISVQIMTNQMVTNNWKSVETNPCWLKLEVCDTDVCCE